MENFVKLQKLTSTDRISMKKVTEIAQTSEMISIFPLWTFHLYVATFQQHLHMEYISQLFWYSRVCGSYHDFLDRGLLLTRKLLNQGFLMVIMKLSLQKFYSRHHDLFKRYRKMCVTNDCGYVLFVLITIRFFPHSCLTLPGYLI